MPNLSDAIVLATRAHQGQVCKQGLPYILHSLSVMARARHAWGYDEPLLVTAVLHDVVEDTAITLDNLAREGFSVEVCEAIAYLSKRPEEEDTKEDPPEEKRRKYEAFIDRIAAGPLLAKRVKVCDLQDNTDPTRIDGEPTERDHRRWAKYRRAMEILVPLTGEGAAHV